MSVIKSTIYYHLWSTARQVFNYKAEFLCLALTYSSHPNYRLASIMGLSQDNLINIVIGIVSIVVTVAGVMIAWGSWKRAKNRKKRQKHRAGANDTEAGQNGQSGQRSVELSDVSGPGVLPRSQTISSKPLELTCTFTIV
ncbi:hypothetical protein B0O99DRAFT_740254 [Bisporella sp. PMI_857]|nr:hypothetical protein B0O99DRAFT_740254 [Bisporella sp. PMI_857]